jgi:predicted LPLAT superfamily acyltransferase
MGFWHRQVKIYQQVLMFAKTLVDRGYQKTHQGLVFQYDLDASADDFIRQLESTDKGIVTVASHFGGWELAMTFFAKVPTGKKMLAVMHGIPGQFGHESSEDTTKSEVVYFNLAENTILKLKDCLAQGQVIGMMGDRPVARSNEMRLFFGKLAVFDTTALRIALACQSQIYFVFACKTAAQRYRVFTFRPPPGTVDEILGHYIQSLERVIDEYPEQWFNFFPFWSEAPKGL